MSETPSLPSKITAIHQSLDAAGVPHAFGGALALAYYAEPRATIDIDLNIFLAPSDYRRVIDALAPLGIDPAVDPVALQHDGQCRLWWQSNPVDLFFAYDPLHQEMRRERRLVPFAEVRLPILSPEHLLICKSVYDRPKDWLDIEQILLSLPHLDWPQIERHLTRLIGTQDSRARRLSELAGRWRD